jgi:hypothetical protein
MDFFSDLNLRSFRRELVSSAAACAGFALCVDRSGGDRRFEQSSLRIPQSE